MIQSLTIKSSGQFKASRFLRSKKARPFKLRADFGDSSAARTYRADEDRADRWRRSSVIPVQRPLWLYRGQMDATWDLVPSRFRQNGSTVNLSPPLNTEPVQTRYREFSLIQTFRAICDREGLLPAGFDLPTGPIVSGNPWWSEPTIEIPNGALDLYGLAQHHGIATRLLDWTTSPLSAAFFAAADNWRTSLDPNIDAPSHFAIWAFVHHGSRQIKVIAPRYSDNRYLRSQRGRFTIDPLADLNYQRTGNWIPHNQLIEEDENSNDGTIATNNQMLVKIIAPSSISENVLIALRYEGVDQASLMPSLDAIARCAQDEIQLHGRENSGSSGARCT